MATSGPAAATGRIREDMAPLVTVQVGKQWMCGCAEPSGTILESSRPRLSHDLHRDTNDPVRGPDPMPLRRHSGCDADSPHGSAAPGPRGRAIIARRKAENAIWGHTDDQAQREHGTLLQASGIHTSWVYRKHDQMTGKEQLRMLAFVGCGPGAAPASRRRQPFPGRC